MMSQFLAHKLLNGVLKQVTYTAPNPPYLALLLSAPAAGQNLDEVGAGYQRKAITCSRAAKNGRIYNTEPITFPRPREIWASTTNPVRSIAVMDAASGGNFLFAGDINARRVLKGDPAPIFPAAGLKFFFDPGGDVLVSQYLQHIILDGVMRNQQFTPPASIWLALLTEPPNITDQAVGSIEVSASDYERKEVTFADADGGWSINDDLVEFDRPINDWTDPDKPVTFLALMDAQAAGRWLFAIPTRAREIFAGSVVPQFVPGEIKVMLDKDSLS